MKHEVPSSKQSIRSSWVPNDDLATLALDKILQQASPIFGKPKTNPTSTSPLSNWMSRYPDSTKLVHMNIPGAHDAATWNYTEATQGALKRVAALTKRPIPPAQWLQCQEVSLRTMLETGIRAFDLRFEQDATGETLVFWHGNALLSQTATVNDVLFAFYNWLEAHPSEVVFMSLMREGNDEASTAVVQRRIYDALTSRAAQRYFLRTTGLESTLGEARGKMILLRRFDLDRLDEAEANALPGIHFSPERWEDNGADFSMSCLPASHDDGRRAYISDHYAPPTKPTSTLSSNVTLKFAAIKAHLDRASSPAHPEALYWGFASGKNVLHDEAMTPRRMARGNEGVRGVNGLLKEYFQGQLQGLKEEDEEKGKRFGIVMFDFVNAGDDELIEFFLSIKTP
ncbi:Hypothetical protein R9X50_00526700 [Acrodontium crateriforme]|uniref:Phosphatidylinositol-specific phospholipase C X domain-containing protein n=1 Tax=Acrodontium crateriforme TaxID=150365 RepID=A0AAQ3M663_9PEZI|nr:Hypothetical protein R9X50_00526700 [Acrodontium crateriforme]